MARWTTTRWLSVVVLAVCGGCNGLDGSPGNPFRTTASSPGEAARQAFNTYDADARRESVNLLASASFGGEYPYVRLYRLLMDDPDATVRAACVQALGAHGQVEDVPLIMARLKDTAPFVRWVAATALQKIHNPVAAGPLIECLAHDDDADARTAAASSLGQYAQPRVFQALVGALDDRAYSVVLAASRSLYTLTGVDLGTDGRAWLEWSRQQGGGLFDKQRVYVWYPYDKPPTFIDKLIFWKPEEVVGPYPPRGLTEDHDTNSTADSPSRS